MPKQQLLSVLRSGIEQRVAGEACEAAASSLQARRGMWDMWSRSWSGLLEPLLRLCCLMWDFGR